jgi:thiamine-monophosphate kinase
MIDVSDGLASELWLLAEATGYSFDIDLERIPFLEETRDVARALSENPLDYALGGGEDFQLLFTVPDGVMLPDGCVVIGRVGDEGPGVRRTTSTGFAALPRSGFDHWG